VDEIEPTGDLGWSGALAERAAAVGRARAVVRGNGDVASRPVGGCHGADDGEHPFAVSPGHLETYPLAMAYLARSLLDRAAKPYQGAQ